MSLEVLLLLAIATAYGLVSGFNDGGNLLASFTAGRVVSPRLAAVLLLFVIAGPLLIGLGVARTISSGVVDLTAVQAGGFVAVVTVSIAVVLGSWIARVPTSMTLALVGAMVGWAVAPGAGLTVRWPGVARVLVGMPISILAGLAGAFVLHRLFRLLLGRADYLLLLRLARLQVLSAILQAVAYGANDMEKTVGLATGAQSLGSSVAAVGFSDGASLALAAVSFFVGTLLGGWRLARRMGFGVVKVRPEEALSQQLAASTAVAALAAAGAPVSSTQTIDGALVGVGAAVRASAIRWGVVREMVFSWLVTLPVAFVVAFVAHGVLRELGAVR